MPSQQPISDDGRDGPLPSHERAGGSGKSAPGVPELAGLSEFNPNAAFAAEALELLPSGFVALTLDGRQLHSNKAFRSMAGREGTVLAGMKFDEFLSRGSAIFYEMHFAPSLLLRGALDEIAFDLLRPDGVQIPVFVKASIRSGSDGGASQLHLTVSNARQRRLYESELLRAKREFEELAEIVRRSADGIIRFNADGIIQSWNHGAEQIFGYSFEEPKGAPLACFFLPTNRTSSMKRWDASGEEWKFIARPWLSIARLD